MTRRTAGSGRVQAATQAAVAALMGGLLALVVLVVLDHVPDFGSGAVLLVALAAVAAAAGALWPGRAATPTRREWLPVALEERRPRQDAAARDRGSADPPPPRTDERAVPAPSSEGGAVAVAVIAAGWWQHNMQADGGAPHVEAVRRPEPVQAPTPATYRSVTRVAQCPFCGDFRLDLVQHAEVFRFTCRPCGGRWSWQSGQPWPPTSVRPAPRPAPPARPAVARRSEPALPRQEY